MQKKQIQNSIPAIPTIGPKGIQFRSRLEAQWAYIFEEFGWKWEYEPIDLKGYIPDFIIDFPGAQVLVEIKPETDIPWYPTPTWQQHIDKIINSGWKGSSVILGASYEHGNHDEWASVGLYTYIESTKTEGVENINDGIVIYKSRGLWHLGGNEDAFDHGFNKTGDCDDCWKGCEDDSFEQFEAVWARAKNAVQWKGQQNRAYMNNVRIQPKKQIARKKRKPKTVVNNLPIKTVTNEIIQSNNKMRVIRLSDVPILMEDKWIIRTGDICRQIYLSFYVNKLTAKKVKGHPTYLACLIGALAKHFESIEEIHGELANLDGNVIYRVKKFWVSQKTHCLKNETIPALIFNVDKTQIASFNIGTIPIECFNMEKIQIDDIVNGLTIIIDIAPFGIQVDPIDPNEIPFDEKLTKVLNNVIDDSGIDSLANDLRIGLEFDKKIQEWDNKMQEYMKIMNHASLIKEGKWLLFLLAIGYTVI